MRIGSLFSGAGGLDLAVQAVFGGEVVWHAEIDKAASKVLAHHWPDVPNLGDVSAVSWQEVPPVDILCGGFCSPARTCQRPGSGPASKTAPGQVCGRCSPTPLTGCTRESW